MKNTLNAIKSVKSDKKLTNAQLSEISGVPLGTVNKILSGATKSIKTETLNKLYTALSISKSGSYKTPLVHGFCKVGAYTPEISLASVEDNVNKIVNAIVEANGLGVSLLVFPKLCLTGATLGSLYYQQALLSSAVSGLFEIAEKTSRLSITSVIGLPLKVNGRIYSVGAVVSRGKIIGIVPENNSSDNVFSSYNGFEIVTLMGNEVPFGNMLFRASNAPELSFNVEFSTDLFGLSSNDNCVKSSITLSLSAIAQTVGKSERIKTLISARSSKCNSGYVLAEAGYGESTTDCVYSGENFIFENGKLIAESKRFSSGLTVSDIDVEFLSSEKSKNGKAVNDGCCQEIPFIVSTEKFMFSRSFEKTPFVPKNNLIMQERAELILDIQSNALKRRILHTHAKTLVIGVSGGLDSTLALLVAVRAVKLCNMSVKDVIAITMPCFGTTKRTKNNAYDLCSALGVTLKEISIKNAVTQHFEDIGQSADIHDVTFENSQARERTQVLMDYANKTGGLVIGTGDLSELALGWATYNGDHMSNYSVNCSIPKTLIRYLVQYESSKGSKLLKDTLLDILDTPVSPELVPPKEGEITQKTEDIVGPYILHDFYLYHAIRRCSMPSKIFFIAKHVFKKDFTPEVLYKWLENFYKRFFAQQFKRSCVPDGVKVGSVSLSPRGDFSMPSDAYSNEWLKDLKNIII